MVENRRLGFPKDRGGQVLTNIITTHFLYKNKCELSNLILQIYSRAESNTYKPKQSKTF